MGRMSCLAKSLLCAVLKYSGAAQIQERLRAWRGLQQLPILIFHRVGTFTREDSLTVSMERFRRMCQLFARSFHVVPLARVFEWMRTRTPFPRRTLAITFDDCYLNNLHAAHLLAEYRLPATFFIPTAYVGTDHVFPWDRHLPRLPNLNWADVQAMADLGHEIGSHSVTHPNMADLSRDQAENELVASKATLEERLGRPCRFFAYPFGGVANWKPEWNDLVVQAGYVGAVSAVGGFVRPDSSPVLLPREAILNFTCMLNLELHLTGCLDWMYALRRSLGLIPGPAQAGESFLASSPDLTVRVGQSSIEWQP